MLPLVKEKVSLTLQELGRRFRIVRKYVDYLVGVDIDRSALEQIEPGIYDELIVADMRDIDYSDYDAVFMFDSIEHIPKEDGYKILNKIESFVMLTTPAFSLSLFLPHPLRWDGHECIYSVEELESLGFTTRTYDFTDLYNWLVYRSIIVAWRDTHRSGRNKLVTEKI